MGEQSGANPPLLFGPLLHIDHDHHYIFKSSSVRFTENEEIINELHLYASMIH